MPTPRHYIMADRVLHRARMSHSSAVDLLARSVPCIEALAEEAIALGGEAIASLLHDGASSSSGTVLVSSPGLIAIQEGQSQEEDPPPEDALSHVININILEVLLGRGPYPPSQEALAATLVHRYHRGGASRVFVEDAFTDLAPLADPALLGEVMASEATCLQYIAAQRGHTEGPEPWPNIHDRVLPPGTVARTPDGLEYHRTDQGWEAIPAVPVGNLTVWDHILD